ncbi:MAG: 1-aminocyclopropane-1-carboxylate deaminase/D-cysteine desulfhydrase [Pseudomonadales bacterium]
MSPLTFPARLSLAQTPTPLVPMERFSASRDLPRIWLKRDDLTHSVAAGNKIRKLEFNLAEAQARGTDVVITYGGLQSNHCRSTAALCASLGIKTHLVLRSNGVPSDAADGNYLLDRVLGAEVSYVSGAELSRNFEQIESDLVAHYRAQGLKAFCIPIGASDATGLWGYVAASAELCEDFNRHNIRPNYIVCASGSGGTQSGLIAGVEAYGLGAKVYGVNVCDDERWFTNKIRSDLQAWKSKFKLALDVDTLPIRILDAHVGDGYAKASDEVLQLIVDVAQLEGVVFDPVYTAKAFLGMLKELENGTLSSDNDIVFIHTGGLYGLFPFRQRLTALGL